MRIPEVLAQTWKHEPDWLRELPLLASDLGAEWDLELEPPFDTPHSLVIPAGPVVLKLNAPSHLESEHEVEALERWKGKGAVNVLARDDARRAFLIERCLPGTRLWDADTDAFAVVGELLPQLRLDLDHPHPFTLLGDEAERWAEQMPRRYELGGRPFEQSMLDFALDVLRSVDRSTNSLVNQDLHGGNLLMAERRPWLLIDPKPLAGEPELDGVGFLRNAATGSPASSGAVRRWLDVLADLGLDRERLRGWGVAHTLAWACDDQGCWQGWSVAAARTIRDS